MDSDVFKKRETLHEVMNRKDGSGNFVFTPFPYSDNYLVSYIGAETVEYHYGKHLRAYIDGVNSLKQEAGSSGETIEDIISNNRCYYNALYKNASQVFNHYFYFEQLNPNGAKQPLPIMHYLIERYYWTLNNLKNKLIDAGMSLFGSGWVFLTTDKYRETLWIRSFTGTSTPIEEIPLVALDLWEHAYYLDYRNDRKQYIKRFFDAIDWSVIENRVCYENK